MSTIIIYYTIGTYRYVYGRAPEAAAKRVLIVYYNVYVIYVYKVGALFSILCLYVYCIGISVIYGSG